MRNRAKCVNCGDIIESVTRHDFKWCSCRSIAVDGGDDYHKRCGEPKDFDAAFDKESIDEEDI